MHALSRRTLAALAVSFTAGCLTPPAVQPAFSSDLEAALRRMPAATEVVELPLEDGDSVLRGVFVPGDEHGPVVLHLMEAGGSVGAVRGDFGALFGKLASIGYSSLALDYAGVGASPGARSVKNLQRDALAMWQEALRRAGGDPSRVVLRGTSLGSLAIGLLLREGVKPGAVVLVAPVFADSAAEHLAKSVFGTFGSLFAGAVFGPVANVDLVRELECVDVPLLVFSSGSDVFLSELEQGELAEAVETAHGTLSVRDGGHLGVVVDARLGLLQEVDFLRELYTGQLERIDVSSDLPPNVRARFPTGSPQRERLAALSRFRRTHAPATIAAAALSNDVPTSERLLWELAVRPYAGKLEFEELAQTLDLGDRPAPIPVELVEMASRPWNLTDHFAGFHTSFSGVHVVRSAYTDLREENANAVSWRTSAGFAAGLTFEARFDTSVLASELRARGLDGEDFVRQYVRLVLKAQRIPDRMRDGALEIRDKDGEWVPLSLEDPDAPTAPLGGLSPEPLDRQTLSGCPRTQATRSERRS